MSEQPDLFERNIRRQFEAWKATPGGRFILQQAYRLSAEQAARFKRCGQRGSVRLVWEQLRYRLTWIRQCARRKGVRLDKWNNYALNDHFHAHVARHILAHNPEWNGLFALRGEKQP